MNRECSNQKVLDEKDRKLFVVSLPHDITTLDLKNYFYQFGQIEDVRIIKNKEVGTMRGFGFVLFHNRVSCIRVFDQGDYHLINGKQVLYVYSRLNAGEYYSEMSCRICRLLHRPLLIFNHRMSRRLMQVR